MEIQQQEGRWKSACFCFTVHARSPRRTVISSVVAAFPRMHMKNSLFLAWLGYLVECSDYFLVYGSWSP